MTTESERLWEIIKRRVKVTESGCHEFQGSKDYFGYGLIKSQGKCKRVSRVIAHIFHGLDMSSKLVVIHKCDNPPCCNPDHIFVGSYAANMRDCAEKGRWRKRKRNPNT